MNIYVQLHIMCVYLYLYSYVHVERSPVVRTIPVVDEVYIHSHLVYMYIYICIYILYVNI
jgi:hypothetical protein